MNYRETNVYEDALYFSVEYRGLNCHYNVTFSIIFIPNVIKRTSYNDKNVLVL